MTDKETKKLYYKAHRKKLLHKAKLYNATHKEEKREYDKQYIEAHKEKRREYSKQYWLNNKEKMKVQAKKNYYKRGRDYERKHYLGVGDRLIKNINKRDWTGYCELCGKVVKKEIDKIVYHHWNDRDIKPGGEVRGVWVCFYCHQICELVDKRDLSLIQRYLRLKRAINKKFRLKRKLKPELN